MSEQKPSMGPRELKFRLFLGIFIWLGIFLLPIAALLFVGALNAFLGVLIAFVVGCFWGPYIIKGPIRAFDLFASLVGIWELKE